MVVIFFVLCRHLSRGPEKILHVKTAETFAPKFNLQALFASWNCSSDVIFLVVFVTFVDFDQQQRPAISTCLLFRCFGSAEHDSNLIFVGELNSLLPSWKVGPRVPFEKIGTFDLNYDVVGLFIQFLGNRMSLLCKEPKLYPRHRVEMHWITVFNW